MAESVTPVVENQPRRPAYYERWLAAEVEYTRAADVAAVIGRSVRQVQRLRAVPGWWNEVAAARGEVVRDAITRLRNGLPIAARRLIEVASNSKTEGTAVRAAIAIFEAHGAMTQRNDLELRLAELEAAVAARVAPSVPGPSPRPRLLTVTPFPVAR